MDTTVNVVLAFDQNYQPMAEILIKSLCYYHKNIALFILSPENNVLTTEFMHNLRQNLIVEAQQPIVDLQFASCNVQADYYTENDYISKATYLRYYIEDLFVKGHSDYWLYLDVDMLIVRDILKPFSFPEFQQYALAAVSDLYVNQLPNHVQRISGDDYFNAGVLYINAAKWCGVKQRLQYITQHYGHELRFADQDALNILFKDQWLKLPVSYNTQLEHQLTSDTFSHQARILHFTGPNKPLQCIEHEDYKNIARYRYFKDLAWTEITKQKTVAVITSTIGRKELERAILSVQNQSYPCQHYVFVDGEQYAKRVKKIAKQYPQVIFTYLPMNTGAGGWTNSHINAIAPFLVKEDIICYLDDDNWYDEHHVQHIVKGFQSYDNIEVVFNLRRFMMECGQYLCDDVMESLGFYCNQKVSYTLEWNGKQGEALANIVSGFMVDTNCLAMRLETARAFAHYWTQHQANDRYIWSQCLEQQKRIYASCEYTVNYILNIKGIKIGEGVFAKFGASTQQ